MDTVSALLLLLSISLSAGRNILSKGISGVKFGHRPYFIIQAATFAIGTVLLFSINPTAFVGLTATTATYAVIYAILMITAQWCYLGALNSGIVSVCATMYSMGFIIPTLMGMIAWSEAVTPRKLIGILTVIPVIVLSGMKKEEKYADAKKSGKFLIPMVIAMLASGTMGIIQKLLALSGNNEQTPAFVIIAFIIATVVSLVSALLARGEVIPDMKRKLVFSSGIGICYASCNLLNTILTGRIESSIFFPTLNISIIVLSMLLGILFFKEKLGKKQFGILALGILSILLITL